MTNEKLLLAGNLGTDQELLLASGDSSLPQPKRLLDADQIDLLEVISRGRFSIVWKSLYKTTGEYVAVKVYPPGYRQYYLNESRIYSWTCMDHENIVRFYGSAEREIPPPVVEDPAKTAAILSQIATLPLHHQQASPQHWIVTAYMPQGTLQDFLKANTVDWEEMCKMGASVACGLAYLHGVAAFGGKQLTVRFMDVSSILSFRRIEATDCPSRCEQQKRVGQTGWHVRLMRFRFCVGVGRAESWVVDSAW